MAKLISLLLLLAFTANASAYRPWKNGGQSSGVSTVKFGTHDWILWKAYLLAKDDVDLTWFNDQRHYAFFGTEAPDVGKAKLRKSFRNQIEGNYKDTSPCHCVLYDDDEEVIQDFAAVRVEQEFTKAKAAIEAENWKLAAFYVGAMAHYIGDLSQFMHLMGTGSRWGNENQTVHANYEKVFEARVEYQTKELSFMESFIVAEPITGGDARAITFEVARYTDTGGGTANTPGDMYDTYLGYDALNIDMKPDQWDQGFTDQSGKNINKAVNAVAKLLRLLMED